tara:strand:+ start:1866 stop:2519 length:654 start_codon:yes stop_codon:yes gene_type:complete
MTITDHTQLIEALYTNGWAVVPDYLPAQACRQLHARIDDLNAADALRLAGIGRDDQHQVNTDIRRDHIHWLYRNSQDVADTLYLSQMESLRQDINRSLFLGLFEYEAHYALYPPGGFYKKHYDALKGGKNRIVSTVFYLNDNWQPGDGGELVLYEEDSDNPQNPNPMMTVAPRMGTLAVFLSEDVPHEVLVANKDRRSIAGWFRCNASSADRVDPLR